MNVRKEMAEKKLSNLARDHEVATEKLTVRNVCINTNNKLLIKFVEISSAKWKITNFC